MIRKISPLFLALIALPLFADADLQVSSLFPPQIHYVVNEEVIFEVRVVNGGPDLARNVRMTFDIPPGLALRSVGGDAPCDLSHRPIVCTGGDLAAGQVVGSPLYGIIFTLPPESTTLTVSATASSDTPDPRPDNNTFRQAINVENVTNLSVSTGFTPARVDPGATTVATTAISNYMPSLPQDIHVHYDAVDATIEAIQPSSSWTCTTNGTSADCTRPSLDENCRCATGPALTLRVNNDRAGGKAILNTAVTTSLPDIRPAALVQAPTAPIYRWLTVTSTADAGPGSLRDAIDQANAGCSDPCRIAFEIPAPVPASGWFTIAPSTALPPITSDRIIVDGTTQTAFTGDTNAAGPEIFLDGRFTKSGHGLEVRSRCDAEVLGLAIGNFTDHGLAMPNPASCQPVNLDDQHLVTHNYLGVDPSGTAAAPNLRGLMADNGARITANVISGNRASGIWIWRGRPAVDNNTINSNGRSGIFFGPEVLWASALENTISFNQEMGVAVAREAQFVDIRGNSMRRNGGLGIDIGLDGPNPPVADDSQTQPNPPVMLSAVYDATANRTIVTYSLTTRFPPNVPFTSVQIDFYANDEPDGDGEAEVFPDYAYAGPGVALRGDLRGKWINATDTHISWYAARPPAAQSVGSKSIAGGQTTTSELSNAVQVQ